MNESPTSLQRSRKFYFATGVVLLATLLRVFDSISDSIYGDIVIYTTGLFMLGNVGEHGAAAWKARAETITDRPHKRGEEN